MEKEKGRLYSIIGAVFLAFFLVFAFFYLRAVTGYSVNEGSEFYIQGMPLVLLTLLFFAGWFLVVRRKLN